MTCTWIRDGCFKQTIELLAGGAAWKSPVANLLPFTNFCGEIAGLELASGRHFDGHWDAVSGSGNP
jgi:hypothetical protein